MNVFEAASVGFALGGPSANGFVIEMAAMVECGAANGAGLGAAIEGVRSVRLAHGTLNGNGMGGLRCTGSGVALYLLAVDRNAEGEGAEQGQILLEGCPIARVDAAHIEAFGGRGASEGCAFVDCGGAALIEGSNITDEFVEVDPPSSIGIRAEGVGPVSVFPNLLERVIPTLVEVDASATDLVLFPQFNAFGGYEVGGDLSFPVGSGAIAMPFIRTASSDEETWSKTGLVIPSGAVIPTTDIVDGMLFYDTAENRLRVRVGSEWKDVSMQGED